MKVCNHDSLERHLAAGSFRYEGGRLDDAMIDDLRIGLPIASILEISGEIDLAQPQDRPQARHIYDKDPLLPRAFYLATTIAAVGLGPRLLGSIHTRSAYARVGLSMGSANMVLPGFGFHIPTPLVLELTVALPVTGIWTSDPLAFLMIYDLEEAVEIAVRDYHLMFPFDILPLL